MANLDLVVLGPLLRHTAVDRDVDVLDLRHTLALGRDHAGARVTHLNGHDAIGANLAGLDFRHVAHDRVSTLARLLASFGDHDGLLPLLLTPSLNLNGVLPLLLFRLGNHDGPFALLLTHVGTHHGVGSLAG